MEKTEKEETKETEEVKNPVELAQVPTEYGLVYQTPDGQMNSEEYLVWIGNLLVGIKEALAG